MRKWRNWQTRTFEGRVVLPYGFKSRFAHQTAEAPIGRLCRFCIIRFHYSLSFSYAAFPMKYEE